jgi:hypothetical protein
MKAMNEALEKRFLRESGFFKLPPIDPWPEPYMAVMRLNRRPPPDLPINVFGPQWGPWMVNAAEAKACPVDYVAAPLLSSVSALIGNARWAQATPGWSEPPQLWDGVVGDSGDGKTPGGGCLTRQVLPVIETRMAADFPDQLAQWRVADEIAKAADEAWKDEVRQAQKDGVTPPLPPARTDRFEPQSPRLRQNDVTIERVATLLAGPAPKGLLIIRDELAGWVEGMTVYNSTGRTFYVEAWNGGPWRVERQKHPDHPILIQHHVVAVYGGVQPDRLAVLMKGTDDGLLARILWFWPDPIPFQLGRLAPDIEFAIDALDRLRLLDLQPGDQLGDPPAPIMVPLTAEARDMIEAFGCEMQDRKAAAGGLMRSAFGKTRGQALRLALVLEFLWWCGGKDRAAPPVEISARAFAAAARLMADYLIAMAERVYGDAAATDQERGAATLARWIFTERPAEIHVRRLQRDIRLPGLRSSDEIRSAADALVEADWLRKPTQSTGFQQRGKVAYAVNPRVWKAA